MFQKLKEGIKGLVEKVAVTQLRGEQVRAILQDFKLSLVENDVAVSVADHISGEMEKRLDGVQSCKVFRFDLWSFFLTERYDA